MVRGRFNSWQLLIWNPLTQPSQKAESSCGSKLIARALPQIGPAGKIEAGTLLSPSIIIAASMALIP